MAMGKREAIEIYFVCDVDAGRIGVYSVSYSHIEGDSEMPSVSKIIGKTVTITNKDHQDYRGWGVVLSFDGEYYHVAMYADCNAVLVFERNEFKVSRTQQNN